jgi:predicted ATPase
VGAVADRTRGPVLAALAEALDAALDGRGGLVLLTGEAGIAKTTTASTCPTRLSGASIRRPPA